MTNSNNTQDGGRPNEHQREWVEAVVWNLDRGDEVVVNERRRSMVVTEIETESPDKIEVTLVGNSTEYTLTSFDDISSIKWPLLQWPSSEGSVAVTSIEVNGSEPAIIAEQYVEDLLPKRCQDWTGSTTQVEDGSSVVDTLGKCPACGGEVCEQESGEESMATCSECGRWCWTDEWENVADDFSQVGG